MDIYKDFISIDTPNGHIKLANVVYKPNDLAKGLCSVKTWKGDLLYLDDDCSLIPSHVYDVKGNLSLSEFYIALTNGDIGDEIPVDRWPGGTIVCN